MTVIKKLLLIVFYFNFVQDSLGGNSRTVMIGKQLFVVNVMFDTFLHLNTTEL